MNLNILKPGQAVESAFKKPNIPLALLLVLLPSLAFIGGRMAYGVQVLDRALYEIVLGYVSFFVLVLVVLALGIIANRKKIAGKMPGLISALSLLQIIALATLILSFALLPLVASPATIEFAVQAGKSASTEMTVAQVEEFLLENPEAVNFTALAVFLAIGLALSVLGLYMLYLTAKKLTESRTLTALLITIVAIIVIGLLPV